MRDEDVGPRLGHHPRLLGVEDIRGRQQVHADIVDPGRRRPALDEHAVADGEPAGGIDLKTPRADRHVMVREVVRRAAPDALEHLRMSHEADDQQVESMVLGECHDRLRLMAWHDMRDE